MKFRLSVLFAALLSAAFMLSSCDDDGPTLDYSNPIRTGNADDITPRYAHLHGQTLESATRVGFDYSTDRKDFSIYDFKASYVMENGNGHFAIGTDKLRSGCTYYYRAFSYIGGELMNGELKTFETPQIEGNFTVMGELIRTGRTDAVISIVSKYRSPNGYKLGVFLTTDGEPSDTHHDTEVQTTVSDVDGKGYIDLFFRASKLGVATTYYYRPYVYNFQTKEYTYGETGKFTTRDVTEGKYVDMGLGVGWARCNLGAKSPEEMGDRFAFGETAPKEEYTKENYLFQNKELLSKDIAGTEFDAARVLLGAGWQTPTANHFYSLADDVTSKYITTEVTTYKGVTGTLFTSKENGNAIFIPGIEILGTRRYYGNYMISKEGYEKAYEGYYVRPVYNP